MKIAMIQLMNSVCMIGPFEVWMPDRGFTSEWVIKSKMTASTVDVRASANIFSFACL